MAVWEWIRFLAGAAFLLTGLGIFVIEMVGVFRFRYILNRMHAAAMGDTLGILFVIMGTDGHMRVEFYFFEAVFGNFIFVALLSHLFPSDCPAGSDHG